MSVRLMLLMKIAILLSEMAKGTPGDARQAGSVRAAFLFSPRQLKTALAPSVPHFTISAVRLPRQMRAVQLRRLPPYYRALRRQSLSAVANTYNFFFSDVVKLYYRDTIKPVSRLHTSDGGLLDIGGHFPDITCSSQEKRPWSPLYHISNNSEMETISSSELPE